MRLSSIWDEYKPHLVTAITRLCFAINSILLQSILSTGISSLVIVVYDHLLATCVVSSLALFLDKGNRPPFSLQILYYSFILGLLLVVMFQMLSTMSLQYVEATYQSVSMNLITVVVFVVAVLFGQEDLKFGTIQGQAKMWGVVVSTAGALTMILWAGPILFKATSTSAIAPSIVGGTMLVVSTLGGASWNLLLGHVSKKYPAALSLSAMMGFCGTAQAAVIAVFLVTKSSWKLKWEGGLVLVAILWGGIILRGFCYYAHVWCVHKKGPVFATAFQPLIIVFSFILEATVLKKATQLGSVIGAVLVVLGLYMLLWGKAKDAERENMMETDESINSPLVN